MPIQPHAERISSTRSMSLPPAGPLVKLSVVLRVVNSGVVELKALIVSLLLSAPLMATADDYKPVTCKERAPYAGKPLHDAIHAPAIEPTPAQALDAALGERLDQA